MLDARGLTLRDWIIWRGQLYEEVQPQRRRYLSVEQARRRLEGVTPGLQFLAASPWQFTFRARE